MGQTKVRKGTTPGAGDIAIRVENLTKRFGSFTAVDGISFSVPAGEVYGWLGPNGAGKTTTIRMLLGLIKPTSGHCRVLGLDPARQPKAMHARVGYMSQRFTLYGDLTARENIRFYGRAYGLSAKRLRSREQDILAMSGIEGRARELTTNLSGGWKQRLALGCAIVHDPEVLFLDEPTAGVDPVSRREFWQLIYGLADSGVTVLVTTHYMDEAELCERVGFIDQGKLVALDTPENLARTHMHGDVIEIDAANPPRVMAALSGARRQGELPVEELAMYGAQVHAIVPDGATNLGPLRRLLEREGIPVRSVTVIAPTLEDVFISAIRAHSAETAPQSQA